MSPRQPHKVPTKAEVLEAITDKVMALRLKPGDILVVQNYETQTDLAHNVKLPIEFEVPIVCAPNGIEKCAINELEEALKIARESGKKPPKKK